MTRPNAMKYVCMNERTDRWTDGGTEGRRDGWIMDGWRDGRIDGLTDRWMSTCICACECQ